MQTIFWLLRAGRPQIGLWVSLSNGFSAEAVAGAGFDWVLIDMEHSPNELASVMSQLQVFAAYDTTPIVRPDWNDPVLVKRLLDLCAPGLLFPMTGPPILLKRPMPQRVGARPVIPILQALPRYAAPSLRSSSATTI
jgi:hypothetical protein